MEFTDKINPRSIVSVSDIGGAGQSLTLDLTGDTGYRVVVLGFHVCLDVDTSAGRLVVTEVGDTVELFVGSPRTDSPTTISTPIVGSDGATVRLSISQEDTAQNPRFKASAQYTRIPSS